MATIGIGATLIQFLGITTGLLPMDDGSARHEAVRNVGLVLAAIIGAPFVMWRSYVAAKQASIAEESLFNDKINAAAAGLAARREVSTEWHDDLVTRAITIDRLEGLVEERPDVAPRVARMLSVYVRELSREPNNAAQESLWRGFYDMLAEEGVDVSDAETHFGVLRDQVTINSLKEWARDLKPVRSDMEKATQALGRLKRIEGVNADDIPIDLRGANLQGFDLRGLAFERAQMQGARMEGAYLYKAGIEGANLYAARLEGAFLYKAQMEGADLQVAWMEGADLRAARMEGANLSKARIEGANLIAARMDEKTDFSDAVVRYAAMKWEDKKTVTLSQTQAESLFGDGSVILPEGIDRPGHWPVEDLDWPEFYNRWHAWQVREGYHPLAQVE